MSDIAIKFDNISKQYRLGVVGTGTITHDLNRWWYTVRGKEDPYLKIGEVNDRSSKAKSNYVWALRNITLDVKQGEVLGIIGKNGAGKSTLLKLLSRVTSPSTGTIKAKGRIASLLEVGTGFHPEMTGKENIFMNGAIMGMTKSEIKRKLDEIVNFAGVEKYIDTPVKRYSSGMTVRLGFAIAAHLEPEILVVDEVLAVGDAEFQKKAIGKMKEVSSGDGRTVLFVSHNMASIRRLCTSGVFFENGTVKEIGDIEKITDLYIRSNGGDSRKTFRQKANPLKEISITEVSVSAENKNEDDIYDINDTLRIKIKYTVHRDIRGTNLSFSLNKDAALLFRSWDIDSDKDLYEMRKAGDYETELVLPDLLNIGTYSITIACGIVGVGPIQILEDIIVFDIDNIIQDGLTFGYSRGGMIRTSTSWNTEKIK
ncbi:ABC transporter ATP-binding protein [Prevotella sp. 10(H)]|uniref:ABC transporter ATP-binding protein n=1 Tax=Prevotella sp. 10(H) TaxID=1158294 RepID=UPI0004A6E7B9|nr:ABC transporter ATP-binding protein [Prevotella sp. 10(H)]